MKLILILLFPIICFSQSSQSPELHLKKVQTGKTLEFLSYPVIAFSGFAGGMGERFLSKDGNWDTRSYRSHIWRDVSIWSTAGGSAMFATGITLQGKVKPKDFIKVVAFSGFYYVGTRIGYNTGQLIK